jgi:hypothetical protein
MTSFNTHRITQLDMEITFLKGKTYLLLDVSHLHEAHLHHLEDKSDATNKLFSDVLEANIWFLLKVNTIVEKKFHSVVHHYENIIKSAPHHCLASAAPTHDVLNKFLNHMLIVVQ